MQIKNFPDYYITEYGEIYSTRLRGKEKSPHLHKLKPKDPGKSNKYLNIILCNQEGQFTKSIHRLVAEYFVDGWFPGAVVNHKDGNNRNNTADNLEWVTIKENVHKSYDTSGKPAKRNFLFWHLYNPNGEYIETFTDHRSVYDFILSNDLDTSPSQLIKTRSSRGYTVLTTHEQIENCNDYPRGVVRR